jgi:DNA replication protein DnaC
VTRRYADESDDDVESVLSVIERCQLAPTGAGVSLVRPDGEWEAEQARMRSHDVADALEATIPRGLAWARFGSQELATRVADREAIAASRTAVRADHVVWVGGSGTGKTSLAIAALRAWVLGSGRAAMFGRAHRLSVARIQHRAGGGEAPYVVECRTTPLLMLDDVGGRQGTVSDDAPVSDVIRDRCDEDLPLWITTGLDAKALAARFDGGAVRRLFERSTIVKTGWH